MKKNKILFPILGLVASTAAIAPIVSLTSCSKNDKKMESHFTFISGTKQVEVVSPALVGQQTFTFKTEDEIPQDEKKQKEYIDSISATAELTTIDDKDKCISVLRCWIESIDVTTKIMTVHVAYSINPTAYTSKENAKVEYQLRIQGNTWYQIETDFSITVKKKHN